MTQTEIEPIREVILKGTEFLLLCHVDPDGDAIGSLLGLGLALEASGRRVRLVSPDGVPANYAFLPGADHVVATTGVVEPGTVAFVLDCGDPERLGAAREVVSQAPWLVNIDHHPTNTGFGRINLVDAGAAATAELILYLLEELSLPLTQAVATCLYTGIHTDTGGFRYENTSASAHRAAQRLVEAGAKPWEIADRVYDTKSVSQLLLLRAALERLKVGCGGRLAWVSLPQAVFAACGTDDTSGLINYPRMIAGVELAILFRETKEGAIRVGFRSRHLDVSRLAQRFGGGGHIRASGCTVPGPLARAEKMVLAVAEKVLTEEQG